MANRSSTHYGPGRRYASHRQVLQDRYGDRIQFFQTPEENRFEFLYKQLQYRHYQETQIAINVDAPTWQEKYTLLQEAIANA